MKVTINQNMTADLESADGTRFGRIPNYDPRTTKPWLSADELTAYANAYPEAYLVALQPPQVPQTLTARQAKLVLHYAGLLASVNAAVSQADQATQIEWEYATSVDRNWPTLIAMANAMGLTSEQLDQMFIDGVAL
jgi:hypothetical protein